MKSESKKGSKPPISIIRYTPLKLKCQNAIDSLTLSINNRIKSALTPNSNRNSTKKLENVYRVDKVEKGEKVEKIAFLNKLDGKSKKNLNISPPNALTTTNHSSINYPTVEK